MATWTGELVCRWVSTPGYNDMGPVAKGYRGTFTDATGQPDANLPPDPNAFVVAFEVDDATAEALQKDADFAVLWLEPADKGTTGNDDVIDDEPARAPGDASRAPTELPATANVTAQERAQVVNKLVQDFGLRGTDLASVIVANRSRREAADRLKAHCRAFPRAKT